MVVWSEKPTLEIFRLEMRTTEAGEAGFARKQPVVNVSMEKPRSETSLPEMESFEACDGGNKVPGFREINQQKLRLPSNEGIMEDRMQHQPRSAVIKMSAESFEVVLGEIDKEIKKYDPKPSVPPISSVSPSINEPNMPSLSGHAAHLSLPSRMPLAEMPSSHQACEG